MKIFYTFILCCILSFSAQAKVVKLTLRKSTPVYKAASFDAAVIAKLKRGDKIYGTHKPKPSGFGYFHKVRIKKGVYGYIPDTAVVGFKKKGKLSKADKLKKKISKKRRKTRGGISGRAGVKKKSKSGRSLRSSKVSLLSERALGLSFTQLNYKLDTAVKAVKSSELFFGLKLSGSGWGLSRVPLDLNFMLSPAAPSSVDSFASDASGMVALMDLSLPLEWVRGKHWSIFVSLGLAVSHYKFDFIRAGAEDSSGATEFGGVVRLGSGYRLGSFIGRLEASYIYVGADHLGLSFSLQRVF